MISKSYPQNLIIDEKEEYRLEQIELRKQRGKGTPKKRTIEGRCRADRATSRANTTRRGENEEEEGPAAMIRHALDSATITMYIPLRKFQMPGPK
jgi:hypothetical protein